MKGYRAFLCIVMAVCLVLPGIALATGEARSQLTAATLDFGTIAVGQTESLPLTIQNIGNADTRIIKVTVTEGFVVSGGADPIVKAGTVNKNYTIAPEADLPVGVHTGTVTVLYAGTVETTTTVQVKVSAASSGTTTAAPPTSTGAAIVVPVRGSATVGETLSIDLSAYGSGASCQWQYCTRNSPRNEDWADLMRANTASYQVPAILTGRYIRAKVTTPTATLYSTPQRVTGQASTLTLAADIQVDYTGEPIVLPEGSVTKTGSAAEVTFQYAPAGQDSYTDGLPIEPGEYTILATLPADANYAAAQAEPVKLTIIKEEADIVLDKVIVAGLSAPALLETLDTYTYSKTGGCRVVGEMSNVTWSPAHDTAAYDTAYVATLSIIPAEGYVFADTVSVTVDGIQTMQYTPAKDGAIAVSVEFHKTAPEPVPVETVLVAVSANEGGKINGENAAITNYSVTKGEDLALTFVPDEGNQIGSITVNGESVEAATQLTLTNLQADTQVEVCFEKEGTDTSILLWSIVALLAVTAFSTAAVVLRRKGII